MIPIYMPTAGGDIELSPHAKDPKRTKLKLHDLTGAERGMLDVFHLRASKAGKTAMKKWRNGAVYKGTLFEISGMLSEAFTPRSTVLAVRFSNGSFTEVVPSNADELGVGAIDPAAVATPAEQDAEKKPEAAARVRIPCLGCPMPVFERAEHRANRVLRTFLSPSQLYDFERYQSFMVIGGDTGRRYMLTSRNALAQRFGSPRFNQVYDADLERGVCVHDWDVPAPEELLALAIFLQLPKRETEMLALPDHG